MNIRDTYNEWAEIYDSDRNLTRDLDAQVTRETFAGKNFQAVLELGCGTGKNTAFFAQNAGLVDALDFSEGMISKARKKNTFDHVRFTQADLNDRWKCSDLGYDLVSANLVLEHIAGLDHIFREARRVLAVGGFFLVNELHPFRQYAGSKAQFERGDEKIEPEAFIHHISDFTGAAERAGLRLEKLNERWHSEDAGKLPRLISFIFAK